LELDMERTNELNRPLYGLKKVFIKRPGLYL
jgi:hypothetical protein